MSPKATISSTYPRAHMRYDGTDTPLPVTIGSLAAGTGLIGSPAGMIADFEAAHRASSASSSKARPSSSRISRSKRSAAAPTSTSRSCRCPTRRRRPPRRRASIPTARGTRPVYLRDGLKPGAAVDGPALIIETTRPSSSSRAGAPSDRKTTSCSTRAVPLPKRAAIGTEADPVMLEVFNNLFMSIAEQMGVMLQNTAYSVNIKERLDFSCAVFDGDGPAGRQRAAHAGPSRLDGPLGRDRHPPQRRRYPPRRRLRPQRALQRRHPPARHHRMHAGVRCRAGKATSCSGSPRAATMPTSAAPRPAR